MSFKRDGKIVLAGVILGVKKAGVVFVHQAFEAGFRQFALAMDRREHRFEVLQQMFAVSPGAIERHEELDFADQVCPTELKKRFRFLFVFEVRTEKSLLMLSGWWSHIKKVKQNNTNNISDQHQRSSRQFNDGSL